MPDYRVVLNGVLLGTLTRTGNDMFWSEGTFAPTTDFEDVRSLFEQEAQLLEAGDFDAWMLFWNELSVGLRLEPTDCSPVIVEFVLHIEGDQARWRY